MYPKEGFIVCKHCGIDHIKKSDQETEWREMDHCRLSEIIDIQAEQTAWYENHWDSDTPDYD